MARPARQEWLSAGFLLFAAVVAGCADRADTVGWGERGSDWRSYSDKGANDTETRPRPGLVRRMPVAEASDRLAQRESDIPRAAAASEAALAVTSTPRSRHERPAQTATEQPNPILSGPTNDSAASIVRDEGQVTVEPELEPDQAFEPWSPASSIAPPIVASRESVAETRAAAEPARMPLDQAMPPHAIAMSERRAPPALDRLPPGPSAETVRQLSRELVRQGFDLAMRGAQYSARAKLIAALRTVAEALDAQYGNREHTDALLRGLEALKESDDFQADRADRRLDLAAIVASHRTTVLKDADLTRVSSAAAVQQYLTYAHRELAIAGGRDPASSVALFQLGRLHGVLDRKLSQRHGGGSRSNEAKAMVFHQAALLADARNYRAAQELGGLLDRFGQPREARGLLQYSLRLHSDPATWERLAAIHERLGEPQLAALAKQELGVATAQLSKTHPPAGPTAPGRVDGPVVWVEPSQFARAENGHPTRSAAPQATRVPGTGLPGAGTAQWPWTKNKR